MKLTFNLADPTQAVAGLSISARQFLDLEGVFSAAEGRPCRIEDPVFPESFEAALKNLVAALLNANPKEAGFWAVVLTKQVGSCTALRAFERLRDNNAKAIAAWVWQEPIEWEPADAKIGSLSSDLTSNPVLP
jgi:hypothetical protein